MNLCLPQGREAGRAEDSPIPNRPPVYNGRPKLPAQSFRRNNALIPSTSQSGTRVLAPFVMPILAVYSDLTSVFSLPRSLPAPFRLIPR
jgi:hypothetical protein